MNYDHLLSQSVGLSATVGAIMLSYKFYRNIIDSYKELIESQKAHIVDLENKITDLEGVLERKNIKLRKTERD